MPKPYLSAEDLRTDENLKLASRMEGYFSGFMPVDEFLDTYLPAPGDKPLKEDLGNSLASIPVQREMGIYQAFIDAIKPYMTNMDIVATHKFRDSSCDHLSPDVSLYPKGSKRDESHPSFDAMSTFVELKIHESLDPFQDPEINAEEDEHGDSQCEREDLESREQRGRIGAYAAAISNHQFRTHVISVSVYGRTARFILWDRAGVLVSEKFDYVQDPQILVGFFHRYSCMSSEAQGIDTSTMEPTAEELDSLPLACAREMRKDNPVHKGWLKVMVPDRADATKEAPFLVSYPLDLTGPFPFSRSSRLMLAFDLARKQLVLLRDYWRPDVDTFAKEADVYLDLEEHQIPHIAPFGTGNNVRDHMTSTQALNNNRNANDPATHEPGLRHYRMTLNVVGRRYLEEFKSSRELVSAIADAMEAHDGAWFKCGILHRDISIDSILITHDGEGLLINWDRCIKMPKKPPGETEVVTTPSQSISQPVKGSWEFRASHLLRHRNDVPDYCDDRESALWVLLWVAFQGVTIHQDARSQDARSGLHWSLPGLMEMFSEVYECSSGCFGGVGKNLFLTGYSQYGVKFTNNVVLDSLVETLTEAFSYRFKCAPTAESVARVERLLEKLRAEPNTAEYADLLADSMAYQYQQWAATFPKQGWLVDTLREYLDKDGWPGDSTAHDRETQALNGSKRKLESEEDALDARLPKRIAHASASGSDPEASSLC
ncbi:hypothetical protein HYPSUDRAFT_217903 [Hypholoma sublateritium FD-334 SS-4]|uniref:Fungal-type protein kinase domain-containing protein n=1 Tax=Hypholoma sublateritium (strain FD-334 SS-4) TaxID=945553 RepID=A0A0D2M6R8_HYPSF|nr:hypothetical protein HYPSUDRAFT_217903 [Hypholoma sublateritium FD-334 SS-4]